MDIRNFPNHLSPGGRCKMRRERIEQELGIDLSALSIDPKKLGHAEEHNCEQMFGHVPIPVGYAGPLTVTFNSGETADVHLPLATTEGALVASVNRGCKALRLSGGVRTTSVHHGVTRSVAFRIKNKELGMKTEREIHVREKEWKKIGEATSNHLKILKYEIDTKDNYLFLTIYADTDEAMGMNMVTIAAEAIGQWMAANMGFDFLCVAANVDSDKKPSQRTHNRGRDYEVTATATVPQEVLTAILKTTPEALRETARAKLEIGSELAGAIGHNCHAANIIAALYLSTGQDPAHIVEGSLADTRVEASYPLSRRERVRERGSDTLKISTRMPSLMVGIRGGGTALPAQQQCLNLLLGLGPRPQAPGPRLHPCRRLAESIGAAVLAGELSLLAALSSHHLAQSHRTLARSVSS